MHDSFRERNLVPEYEAFFISVTTASETSDPILPQSAGRTKAGVNGFFAEFVWFG